MGKRVESAPLQHSVVESPWLTRREAACLLRCSTLKVKALARAGHLDERFLPGASSRALLSREQVMNLLEPRDEHIERVRREVPSSAVGRQGRTARERAAETAASAE